MSVTGANRTSGMSAEVSLTRVENVDADRLAAHGVKLGLVFSATSISCNCTGV